MVRKNDVVFHHNTSQNGPEPTPGPVQVSSPLCSNDSQSSEDEEDNFEDAIEDGEDDCDVTRQISLNYEDVKRTLKTRTDDHQIQTVDKKTTTIQKRANEEKLNGNEDTQLGVRLRRRRQRIPDKPDISFSLWSIMKNCIGKDLTKIPVPVNFSEPLSMLQRLAEDFEYSEILDAASLCTDSCEQMAFVAAFTVSSYSTTAIRTGKPFNPLLGETFECDRSDDKKWKCISEQVSHHPPMLAQYCESNNQSWKCWQEFTMKTKFKGKYLEVEPLGIAHLTFTNSGNHYTWRKVKTVVHNIIIGKLWIDQTGEMEIINHKTGDRCNMKFEPCGFFGASAKKVTGTIVTKDEEVKFLLNGAWDSKLESSDVRDQSRKKVKDNFGVGPWKTLWNVTPPDLESQNYYNFTRFACELNDEEEGIAPTDSRLRPDQRMMENGNWDAANSEKLRLEEKQRGVRKDRQVEAEKLEAQGRTPESYQPVWFHKVPDEQNGGKLIHMYKGEYWEVKQKQNWNMCPDIF